MKIVVDTNIIFSGLLSPAGSISDLLLNSSSIFQFYSPAYLLDELDKHKSKLLKLTQYSEKELDFLQLFLLKKVDLIDLNSIDPIIWAESVKLTRDVNTFDAPFVALAIALDAPLWTGDKKLIKGLKKKNINWVITSEIVKDIRESY